MKREDIQKLVGGYAAGILTEQERQELFAAALDDQSLFDELMGEQPLRELLEDPSSRREIRQALAPAAPRRWLWAIPATVALATVAFLVMLIRLPERTQMAQVTLQRAPQVAPPPAVQSEPEKISPKPRPKLAQPAVSPRKEENQVLPPPPEIALAPQRDLDIPGAPEPAALGAREVAPPQETARAEKAAAGTVRPMAPAPPPAPSPALTAFRATSRARDLFYGLSRTGAPGMFRRTAEQAELPLGVRFERKAGVLTVETNTAAHLRVFAGEELLFDGDVVARSRSSIAAPEGKALRLTVARPGLTSAGAARVVQERIEQEGATYAVAERGATFLTVTVP